MKKLSDAAHPYLYNGMEIVKHHYPDCLGYVESVKDLDFKKLLFELSAQKPPLDNISLGD